jgi:hypothetical protein
MIQRDGSILRVIDEKHGPWTNGDVNKPSPTGLRVIGWGGNPNIWSLSIEAEGNPNDNMPKAQMDAIEWQVRTWQRQYDIGNASVIRHADLNSVTRSFCPGSYYDEIMRRIATDTTPAPSPDYATPSVPSWMTEEKLAEGIDRRVGAGLARACRREFRVTAVTPRLKYAYPDAPRVGPDLKVGETFIGEFVIESKGRWYVLTRWGTRVQAENLSPKVMIV